MTLRELTAQEGLSRRETREALLKLVQDAIAERGRQTNERVRKLRRRVHHLPRTCEDCRESFIPKRADARFCGAACKQRHFRARRAA